MASSAFLPSTQSDFDTDTPAVLDFKLGLPQPPPTRRHAPRASTASTASTADSFLPTYPADRNRPPSYYTASSPSVSKLRRQSFGPSEVDDSATEPDSDLLLSPAAGSVHDDDDDADHFSISATLDRLSSQRHDTVDPLDRLMAQSQQILETTQEILKSCIDSRRQLDRYTNLESTMSESLFNNERQLRRSLSENEDREEELDKLARDVEAYATGSTTSTTRPGFGQLLGTQTDPRAFMTRSATSGHRSRSSISQLQLAPVADQLPTSTSATAIDSLTAALSPTSTSFPNTPSIVDKPALVSTPSRASDVLAGMLGSAKSTPAATTPTPPASSPSAAVAALIRRTSSYASLHKSSSPPSSPTLSSSPSGASQRRVTSPHLSSPSLSHARPSLAHSRSALTFQSVAEEDSLEQPDLVPDTDNSTPVKAGNNPAPSSPVTPRTVSPAVRRPMMGHARKAPSISSLSMLTGAAMSASDPTALDSAPKKSYGGLTRSEGYRSLSTPSPLAKAAPAAPFQPTLEAISPSVPSATPIAIEQAPALSTELASSVASAHQRPSSLQQRDSSAGEDLMRVHAEGTPAVRGHRRKDSNLKDTLEGLRGVSGAEAKGVEGGSGWWGWR